MLFWNLRKKFWTIFWQFGYQYTVQRDQSFDQYQYQIFWDKHIISSVLQKIVFFFSWIDYQNAGLMECKRAEPSSPLDIQNIKRYVNRCYFSSNSIYILCPGKHFFRANMVYLWICVPAKNPSVAKNTISVDHFRNLSILFVSNNLLPSIAFLFNIFFSIFFSRDKGTRTHKEK